MRNGIERRGKGELRVGHADFLPIIQARHAAHSHLEHVEQFRLPNIPAQADHAPVFIEIAEYIDRHKGLRILLLHGLDQTAKVVCTELEIQHSKVEDQGQAGVLFLAQIEACNCRVPGHFADGELLAIFVAQPSEFPGKRKAFRLVGRVFCFLKITGWIVRRWEKLERERIVTKLRILE